MSRKWIVLRGPLTSTFLAAALGVVAVAAPARAEPPSGPRTVFEMPVRGGLAAAVAAAGDRASADRSRFLLDVIHRLHEMPLSPRARREAPRQTLIAHLDQATAVSPSDTLPLPLHPDIWINAVFGGRGTPDTLLSSIVGSRGASLLYYGLLSVDDPTRAWFARQPDLLAEIAARHAAPFVLAAPGLRISDDAIVQVPGGEAAIDVWRTLVGRPVDDPAGFVRELLTRSFGRLAYFFGAVSQLSPAQLRFALALDAPDPAQRLDAGRRLAAVFERLAANWKIEERVFWRPALDPVLLISELAPSPFEAPSIRWTRSFWNAAFEAAENPRARTLSADESRALAEGEPADFVWLCEQVFKGGQIAQRRPYELVLFAARAIEQVTADNARDAIDAIRGVTYYPALIGALERAGVRQLGVVGAAVRRATALSGIGDAPRARRVLTHFQGSLALLTRAAARGSLTVDSLSTLVSSLAAIELADRDEYDGRIVRWWEDVIDAHARMKAAPGSGQMAADFPWVGDPLSERFADAVGPLDRGVVHLVAGPVEARPRMVDWEGTRYRVDPAWAEATRLGRLLGERPRPYLSSALALVRIADALANPQLERAAIQEHAAKAEEVQRLVGSRDLERTIAMLQRAASESSARAPHRFAAVSSSLRSLADDLFARGLTELVYATALGQADGARIVAEDAAARHDFGLRLFGSMGAWRFPVYGADRLRDWHVTGSLLGLDVKLSDLALLRISSRLPMTRPTLGDADRRVFIETAMLMDAAALTDADRDRIVTAIRNGRKKLADAHLASSLFALADEIGIRGPRRTLLAWAATHDPERLESMVSLTELLWLGLEGHSIEPRLHAWGVSAEPRLGCFCLRVIDRRPLDVLEGRWDSGVFASGFPDLNLRFAELLAELEMPALLLPYVLTAATGEFINAAASRGPDDRRGLVEYVRALEADRLEDYLAMLTTDGPLVAIGEIADAAAGTIWKTEVSQ